MIKSKKIKLGLAIALYQVKGLASTCNVSISCVYMWQRIGSYPDRYNPVINTTIRSKLNELEQLAQELGI